MAFIVARRSGTWEIRESKSTPAGPRARTLATFRALTPEVIEHAQARSTATLDPGRLRKAAVRAGAPVATGAPDRAAGELLAEIGAGHRPRPALARLLIDALRDESAGASAGEASDSARAASAWVGATVQRRGETLRDLLLLTDRLPPSRAPVVRRFPRLRSRPA
jgi:hypothetical protein